MVQRATDLEIVIREVTSNVWTFSAPFKLGILPFGIRSTAIRLSNGDVWVLASTPLTEQTKEGIDKLGSVKWIMNSSLAHHFHLGEFKKAYPDAKLIGVNGIGEKKSAEGLVFDGEYGKDLDVETRYGFEDEIKSCYFSGSASKEVAWYHTASKTLIVGDLMVNLPATEQFSKSKTSAKLPFINTLSPSGMLLKRTLWGSGLDKDAMRRDIKTVSEWDFERIILAHGNIIEKDAKKAWENAYSKYRS
ncbi:hypothetical protein K435DRAFT_435838 [Dendrothele bispora CBS 962.96]|uniref:DUF4336 domain-containing protein n=1 Tax=Dendrothele bispora (strain CBS 962.96) TaxID=1314807 RepID=A0A4S8L3Y6_DENBC|nr:hypothetical protein K435DRAFT_435838 [Dendrothele bispora CBS 962.96]